MHLFMAEKSKKLKKCFTDVDSLFFFLLRGTREGENAGLKLVFAHENGTVWRGKQHYALRFRVASHDRLPGLAQIVRVLIKMYAAMTDDVRKQKGGRR